jgi:hypothetical protein
MNQTPWTELSRTAVLREPRFHRGTRPEAIPQRPQLQREGHKTAVIEQRHLEDTQELCPRRAINPFGPGNERNQVFERLIVVKIKANTKKALPALANGQVWKTETAYIQIVELGKRLIDYRMMRQLGQSRRTQTSSIETMENYLKSNEARLVKGNSRN